MPTLLLSFVGDLLQLKASLDTLLEVLSLKEVFPYCLHGESANATSLRCPSRFTMSWRLGTSLLERREGLDGPIIGLSNAAFVGEAERERSAALLRSEAMASSRPLGSLGVFLLSTAGDAEGASGLM